jgi:HPt (histidine-containing phosphotransfer) domain-containing protein
MGNKEIQEKLEQVRQSYIATLDEKKNNIQTLWQLLKNDWQQAAFDNLYMIIHGLAGSAETFGFPDLTVEARAITNFLKQYEKDLPNEDFINLMEDRIVKLISVIEKSIKSK